MPSTGKFRRMEWRAVVSTSLFKEKSVNVGGGFAGRDNGCVLDCTVVMLAFVNIPSTTKFYDIWTILLYLKKII